jgi:predicted Zn finger-like uncharacterized protein
VIIACINCNKKFDINASVIPENGRLLQCSSCNHKWFFKKKIINKPFNFTVNDTNSIITKIDNEQSESTQIEKSNSTRLLDNQIEEEQASKIVDNSVNIEPSVVTFKNKTNYNILGLIIVFIISFIALIIILDTFQNPLSKIVPDIEFILYNLYETFNDISLFLTDLF